MTTRSSHDVVVIGAGVIGLSTAVVLAERGQRVEVRARLAPAQTTSAVAAAMIGPAMAPAEQDTGRLERASIAQFTALADTAGTGVTIRRGRLASRQPGPPPPGDTVPCGPTELCHLALRQRPGPPCRWSTCRSTSSTSLDGCSLRADESS